MWVYISWGVFLSLLTFANCQSLGPYMLNAFVPRNSLGMNVRSKPPLLTLLEPHYQDARQPLQQRYVPIQPNDPRMNPFFVDRFPEGPVMPMYGQRSIFSGKSSKRSYTGRKLFLHKQKKSMRHGPIVC